MGVQPMLVAAGCCLRGAHVYSGATYTSVVRPRALFLRSSRCSAFAFPLGPFFFFFPPLTFFHHVLSLSSCLSVTASTRSRPHYFLYLFFHLVPHRSSLCMAEAVGFIYPLTEKHVFFSLSKGRQNKVVTSMCDKMQKRPSLACTCFHGFQCTYFPSN